MIAGIHIARDSPVHRLAPGAKLAMLPIFATALFLTGRLPIVAGALLLVLALYALARLPRSALFAQLRPALAVLAFIFLAQLFVSGWLAALVANLRFLALILAAGLVSLTTPTSDLVSALERGFGHLSFLGFDAARIGLAISLVLRFIPVLGQVLGEIREAQGARGRDRSAIALAVPLVVRTLKMADEIAEAIDARS